MLDNTQYFSLKMYRRVKNKSICFVFLLQTFNIKPVMPSFKQYEPFSAHLSSNLKKMRYFSGLVYPKTRKKLARES